MKTDVTVIGPGNWGSSLLAGLRRADIPVREVVATRRRRGIVTLCDAQLDARILWLCVPDSAIAPVAAEIVARRRFLGRSLSGQMVIHSSGALTVEALRSAHNDGATVASAHPVMTFPSRKTAGLRDVLFGVEAEQKVRRRVNALIRQIGGRPFGLESEKKAMYHAAGTLASPLLVSELSSAITTARLAGLSSREARQWVGVLAKATIRNVFEHGEAKSFSGPFARGDTATIRLHLGALGVHPILTEIYRYLGLYAVEALPVKNRAELRATLKKV